MGLKDYFKINRRRALLVLFFITLTQATTTVYTYLTSPQLNALSQGKFVYFIELIAVQFILGQICNVSFNYSNVQNTRQTQDLFHQVRQKIVAHYYQEPAKVSEMKNHLGNDLQLVQESYYDVLFYFVCDFIYILLTIATLFTFHWLLVAYTLIDTLLAVVVSKLLEKYTNQATETVSSKNANFLHVIENWFNGLAELRRYQNKKVLKQIVGKNSYQLEKSEYERDKALAYTAMVAAIFNIAGRVGVPLIAGILFFNHQVNMGVILTAGYFANGIFYSVDSCVNRYMQLKSTKTLRNRLAELQQVSSEKRYDSVNQIASVQVKDLSIEYPSGEKIAYPDFVLNEGDKALLTGDSGTGKSTLMKAMLGQIKPKTGEVLYLDKSGKRLHPDLRKLGYLAQDLLIFPGSIADNITMFNSKFNTKANNLVEQMAFEDDQARFDDGLNTQLDPHRELLSGGQQQKVVLMRLLLHQTPVLYLDEATSAIDQKATTMILRNLMKTNATLLMIAHNLTPEQKALFDREIYLEGK